VTLKQNQGVINTVHLLSRLNDPKLGLEDFEATFLQGLQVVFQNEFSILLLIDAEGSPQVQRKFSVDGNKRIVSDEVHFEKGLMYRAFEKVKFFQFTPDQLTENDPFVDVPDGMDIHAYAVMPLVVQNQLLGVLAMGNFSPQPLSDSDEETFKLLGNFLADHIYSIKMIFELESSNSVLLASQQQLINSRNTLRTLFDNIPESFYIVDESYTLMAVNLSRADRAGTAPRELVGGKCYEGLFRLNSPCPGCLVAKTLDTRVTETRRVHYLQKDQSILEWEIHTYLVSEATDKPRQVILLEQNITEKRKLEAELIQSEKLAAVGQLAAGIAHDINNPLTSIIANAQILIADLPEGQPDLLQCARLIELAGTKATQVVRNLLTSARKEEFQFSPVDITESIQRALMLLSHEFISRDINICFNRGYEMPEISASDNHLQSVWTNLIMNSIEAIGDHSGRIDIGTQFDGENFIVSIQDSGQGIPNEFIGQIFEPFFTTKHSAEGTGLGLTSVKRIIQAHNGRIQVESEEGKGTTFTVVLPKEQITQVH
jgi:two-component system NtrC family sensor kinase